MGWPQWTCHPPSELSKHLLLNEEVVGSHALLVAAEEISTATHGERQECDGERKNI